MRKTAVLLSTLALSTLALAACGGGAEEADESTAPATAITSEEASEEEAAAEAASEVEQREAEAAEEEASEKKSADGATGASDPGPAAEDAVIPADAVAEPPQEIGAYSLMEGSGPAHMYSHSEESILISVDSTVLSSDYETLVAEIETDNVPAGTGSCGTNEAGSSITCYQLTEDGVITLNAVPEEISVEEMALFVNQYAEQVGAA
ncbi:hypothetical protein H3H54_03865 [Brachybacterium sp. Z12]|uniref:hypothetical protein n=1 Tax=Brachybacterium sp. Z12 TaxID=2759167 RepID=UPI00185FAC6F|nr:hypothetical protein [Brachybacterium sp. Z12]QNN82958.1 hypothetical protein H3H54_03865 [Brachybacterium sp. Z12]